MIKARIDRRISQRQMTNLHAWAMLGEDQRYPVKLQDISREGMQLLCHEYVKPGHVLHIEVALPDEEHPMEFMGKVVAARFIHAERQFSLGLQMIGGTGVRVPALIRLMHKLR